MRLSKQQAALIRDEIRAIFGPNAKAWLFGSRACDERLGGDIDVLVRPDLSFTDDVLRKKVRLLARLERLLGERKIDVVIEAPDDPRPIVRIAREHGVLL